MTTTNSREGRGRRRRTPDGERFDDLGNSKDSGRWAGPDGQEFDELGGVAPARDDFGPDGVGDGSGHFLG